MCVFFFALINEEAECAVDKGIVRQFRDVDQIIIDLKQSIVYPMLHIFEIYFKTIQLIYVLLPQLGRFSFPKFIVKCVYSIFDLHRDNKI